MASSSASRTCTFLAISDTHNYHDQQPLSTEGVDVLLHSGDMTMRGTQYEVETFYAWLKAVPVPQKIVTAGNHDACLDPEAGFRQAAVDLFTSDEAKAAGIIYIGPEDPPVVTRAGRFKVYGSPYTPEYWGAFQRERGQDLAELYATIPSDVDIVMTHGPAWGIGDAVVSPNRHPGGPDVIHHAGSPELLAEVVTRVCPAVCVAGHIHEGYGANVLPYAAATQAMAAAAAAEAARPRGGAGQDGGAAPRAIAFSGDDGTAAGGEGAGGAAGAGGGAGAAAVAAAQGTAPGVEDAARILAVWERFGKSQALRSIPKGAPKPLWAQSHLLQGLTSAAVPVVPAAGVQCSSKDGITFINAASCNVHHSHLNGPVWFTLTRREGEGQGTGPAPAAPAASAAGGDSSGSAPAAGGLPLPVLGSTATTKPSVDVTVHPFVPSHVVLVRPGEALVGLPRAARAAQPAFGTP